MSSELNATVEAINVVSGQKVGKGQLLIKLRADEEQSAVNSQLAVSQQKADTVKAKQADVAEAKADLDLAQSQFNRYKRLFQQELISQNQYEEYETRLKKAQSVYESSIFDLASAKSDLKQAKAGVAEKKAQLDKLRIIAPFSGTIQDIPVKVGDLVLPETKLLSIANVDKLEIYISIPSDKAALVNKDSQIELIGAGGENLGKATIFFISSTVDPQSQTVLVKALVDNFNGLFRDGQEVKGRINFAQKSGILVPTTSVSRFGGSASVFVIQKRGKKLIARQRPITVSDAKDGFYCATKGLDEGEIIALTGLVQLQDGAEVVEQKNGEGSK
jgi:RND family efflux transporter MFP subunit